MLTRRLTAEWLGTFSLLATVGRSGITAKRLVGGNVAIALLGNTIPTGAILVVRLRRSGRSRAPISIRRSRCPLRFAGISRPASGLSMV